MRLCRYVPYRAAHQEPCWQSGCWIAIEDCLEECCGTSVIPTDTPSNVEVSFFDKLGDDFVRSCTSIQKEDGSNARRTALDPTGLAYQHLCNGIGYTGPVILFGKKYLPTYVPTKDSQGNVIGAFAVGTRIV